MKPKHKTLISITTLFIIVGAFIYYLTQHLEDFKSLTLVNPILLIILVVLFIISYILISIITKTILKPLKVNLKHKEAFMLSVTTGFYNLITPFKGGMAVRAVYLKKKYQFTYINFLASLTGMYVVTFLIASLVGIVSTLIIYLNSGIFSWVIFMIFLGMFVPLFLIVIFSPKFKETKNDFVNKFIKVINGWNLIKSNKKVVLTITLISFTQLVLSAFMIFFSFKVFGIEVEFVKCLFLASIASLGLLISITPAGLGINEAIIVFSALTIGITPTQSLSVALLNRAVQMLVLFILGPLFSLILIKNGKQKHNKK